MSFFSLTMSSIRLYFYQRLGVYSDKDPPMPNMIIVAPFIFFQNIILIFSWAAISSYLKLVVILCVFLVICVNFLTIQTFIFHWKHERKIMSAQKRKILERNIESEISSCFWTALLTPWISPYTVWFNALANDNKIIEKHFLVLLSLPSITTVSFCIGALYAYLIFDANNTN